MSVTGGFYNSLNGDRKYDARQMSQIFDGIVKDGVFASIGTAFKANAAGGLVVNVGIGRAWFDHSWIDNDSIFPITMPESEVLLGRIDAIVFDIDSRDTVRANSIISVKGTPASEPTNPTLVSEENHHQYPICYIKRTAESTEIAQADITNAIGTEATPFITGILETVNIEDLYNQWNAQIEKMINNLEEAISGVTDRSGLMLTTGGTFKGNVNFSSGSTMTLSQAPSADMDAVTKSYADTKMPKTGGTFTGDVTAYSTNRATNSLRNILVQDSTGTTNQSTDSIIMWRK